MTRHVLRNEGNVLFNNTFNTFYLRLYGRKEGNVLFNDALNTFYLQLYGRKEGNVLFNDALNTFHLQLYGRKKIFYLMTHSTHFIYGYMEGRKKMFYLTMHSTHFIYGYMEGRKKMFYLTTHSTHFIYSYMEGRKKMFYLTTHSTHFIYGYMVSNIWLRTTLIVRKETHCRHIGYSFQLTFFYMHHPTYRIAHTTAFVTPVMEHWLELEIAQWVHPMKDRSDDPSLHEQTLLPRSYISLLHVVRNNYRDKNIT